jgi:glycolate oxidase iron-sulfur subunit
VTSTTNDPDIWIFTGCVMNAWQRSTHRSLAGIARTLGLSVGVPGASGSCCGALHSHQGLTSTARDLALGVMKSMPGTAPVVVDSAGCGAALKDYEHLVGTAEAADFARRVVDVHEWLAPRMDDLIRSARRDNLVAAPDPVIVQDPCHLRHVQRTHGEVRTVLGRVAEIVELDDDGLCCGAGGAFSTLQPDLAEAVRARKLDSIRRAQNGRSLVVASANPGCLMFLAGTGLDVQHPIDIVARQLGLNE